MIDDDVAVKDSTWTAGRRGVGATILAEKICGAAAEAGQSLEQVRELCKKVNAQGRSMGMALTSCTVPHVGKPTFALPEDEMEVGVGIHGEPGRTRMKIKSADEIVELLMEPIITDLPYKSGDEVLMFVNGLGGTPLIELYIVYRKAAEIAKKAGLKITRKFRRLLHHQPRDGGDLDHAAASSTTSSRNCGTRPCTRLRCGGGSKMQVTVVPFTQRRSRAALAAELRGNL